MKELALPIKLHLSAAVARSEKVSGLLPLASLSRLAAAVATDAGGDQALSVELAFSADAESLGRASGRMQAVLMLSCQRCLMPTAWPLELKLDWTLVADEASEARLLGASDPVWVDGDTLMLHERLEDEALLALPIAPVCADRLCSLKAGKSAGETSGQQISDNHRPGEPSIARPNPFASLKGQFPKG